MSTTPHWHMRLRSLSVHYLTRPLAPCWQRMGCAEGAHGGARVRAVLDLSNRPHFESNLPLDEENVGAIEYGKCV